MLSLTRCQTKFCLSILFRRRRPWWIGGALRSAPLTLRLLRLLRRLSRRCMLRPRWANGGRGRLPPRPPAPDPGPPGKGAREVESSRSGAGWGGRRRGRGARTPGAKAAVDRAGAGPGAKGRAAGPRPARTSTGAVARGRVCPRGRARRLALPTSRLQGLPSPGPPPLDLCLSRQPPRTVLPALSGELPLPGATTRGPGPGARALRPGP